MQLICSKPLKTLSTKHFFYANSINFQLLSVPLQPMNRTDVELSRAIQSRLQGYCGKVLAMLVNDYREEEPWLAEDALGRS